MDALLSALKNNLDVTITCLYGSERSRYLLRCSLVLLAKNNNHKIYYITERKSSSDKIYRIANYMPFDAIGVKIAKCRTRLDSEADAELVICPISYLVKHWKPLEKTFVLIFDITTLETFEESVLSLHGESKNRKLMKILYILPKEFSSASIVMACNGPLDGPFSTLGYKMPLEITATSHFSDQHLICGRSFASIVTHGPLGARLCFRRPKDTVLTSQKDMYSETGEILEKLLNSSQGNIVIFFPNYNTLVDYHASWRKSGVLTRIGINYTKENGDDTHYRVGLHTLAQTTKSMFMCSMRHRKDEDLAEIMLGQVRLVIIMGLPYTELTDLQKARFEECDYVYQKMRSWKGYEDSLSGQELCKSRAIEYMNGVIKRCLVNEYRSKPCSFFILDHDLAYDRHRIAKELGDVPAEDFDKALARFQCHA